ncbi:MAG TPA: DUF4349 domain-containing protein [Pyrinomonadaceae bacterium]|nr:DUF4349 domain-containing protein [Pyrinomonadaceae bacterium]
MKSPLGLLLILLLAFAGCSSEERGASSAPTSAGYTADNKSTANQPAAEQAVATTKTSDATYAMDSLSNTPHYDQVSMNQVDTAASAAEAADRKIIRNANLTMEVNSTSDMQHKVTSIAESHGGFVVTSEAKQRESADPAKRTLDIKLVVRVPSERFGSALDSIRGLANTLKEENVTGNDVTEEFIDLEARIRTQKALELQFLDIMKQARKVEDALQVQRQIAEVRTDIEKLEGRKRFLENRSSLSTITVNLETPRQIVVNTGSFGRSLRESVSDGVDFGSALILLLVRFVIVMIPVTIFLLLPLGVLFRYFVRRAKRIRLAEALSTPVGD